MSQSPLLWDPNLAMASGFNPEATPFMPSSSRQPSLLRACAPDFFFDASVFGGILGDLEHDITQPEGIYDIDDGYFSGFVQSIEENFDVQGLEQAYPMDHPGGIQSIDGSIVVPSMSDFVGEDAADIDAEHDSVVETSPPRPSNRKRNAAQNRPAALHAGIKKPTKKGISKMRMSRKAEEVLDLLALSIPEKFKQANIVIEQQTKQDTLKGRLGQHVRIERNDGRVTIGGVFWYPPRNDPSIPITQAEKTACAKLLVAAMLDTTECKEQMHTQAFKNRWGPHATFYTVEELLNAAWILLDTAVAVHEHGWTSSINDQHTRAAVQKTMFCTFQDRFDALLELLKGSKRTCETIMKGERINTIIGNPWELVTRTSSNARSNKAKGETLKMARKRSIDEAEIEEEGAVQVVRPVKKMKRRAV